MENKDKLLSIIEWLDKKRWESPTNYNIIKNKIFNDLSSSEKILVHWICYIADRQMPFEKIWVEGGSVFSGIVKTYFKESYENIKKNDIFKVSKDGKIKFVSEDSEYKEFSSRFTSTDLKSILLTFRILEDYDKNIVSYTNLLYNKFLNLLSDKENNEIILIASILHLLSYEFIKNNKKKEIVTDKQKYFKEIDEYYKKFKDTISTETTFKVYLDKFRKTRFKGKKRTWCCIRDYLKSKEFRKYFLESLNKEKDNKQLLKVYNNPSNLLLLELPGDVWNTNPIFINKLVNPNIPIINNKNFAFSLRKILEPPNYPEQFDLTFDFVPRMCAHPNNKINKTMCKICPFGESGMKEYCHSNKVLQCPVTMICCEYENKCNPDNCPVKKKISLNLCRSLES